jgi:2-keto-4-pentenoate hydratase/2-oxohepta-3-ene-1,7-dioic acid hydratase in catechol pathway
MTRLASVILGDGSRRAAVIEGEEAWVCEAPGIDAALASGVTLAGLSGSPGRSAGLQDLAFDAPLRPPVIFCLGQNYRDHLDEKPPVNLAEPEFFLKAGQTLTAPSVPCVYPRAATGKLDYETELGVVIGRTAHDVRPEAALDFVAGYVVLNDLTARDRQVVRSPDGSLSYALGPAKNFDGSARIGPFLETADAIGDPQGLELSTTVSGELRQLNTTAAMIFPVAELIAFLSRLLTLQRGAVISTGTPGGTGWGTDTELGGTGHTPRGCVPARYLQPGDTVVGRIERVGTCEFQIVNEKVNGPDEPWEQT